VYKFTEFLPAPGSPASPGPWNQHHLWTSETVRMAGAWKLGRGQGGTLALNLPIGHDAARKVSAHSWSSRLPLQARFRSECSCLPGDQSNLSQPGHLPREGKLLCSHPRDGEENQHGGGGLPKALSSGIHCCISNLPLFLSEKTYSSAIPYPQPRTPKSKRPPPGRVLQ